MIDYGYTNKIILNIPLVHSTTKTSTELKIDTLYLCPFKNKPDSTNRFIK